MKDIFCMQINIKVSCKSCLQVNFKTFLEGDTIIIDKHDQAYSKYSIILQYLFSNLKKEVRDGVYFLLADKHQSFYKMTLSFLIEVTRYMQITQNRKLVISLQYLKK